jgi:hypothetical protein
VESGRGKARHKLQRRTEKNVEGAEKMRKTGKSRKEYRQAMREEVGRSAFLQNLVK